MAPWFRPRPGLEATAGFTERVLAVIRVLLSAAALVAMYFDAEPTAYPSFVSSILISYVVYSIALLAVFWRGPAVPTVIAVAIEVFDLLAAVTLTLFTAGMNSPFFVMFGFVLLSTAYRWGLQETLLLATVTILVFGIEAILVTTSRFPGLAVAAQFDLNRFIMRCAFAVIIGYLAEQDKVHRAELALLARTLSRVQQAGRFTATLRAIAWELLAIFGSDSLCLVTEEKPSGRAFLWKATVAGQSPAVNSHPSFADRRRSPAPSDQVIVQMTEMDQLTRERYRLPDGVCGLVSRDDPSGRFELRTADEQGGHVTPTTLPVVFLDTVPVSRALVVSQTVSDEWRTRLFILDPHINARPPRALHLLRSLTSQLAPLAYSAYLLGRLRSRAIAADRARVARELHDSVIQSLMGIRMRIEALKIRNPSTFEAAPDLAGVGDSLEREVVKLRMLMFELTSRQIHTREMERMLAEIVDRFEHASGISSHFVSDKDAPPAPARVCHEISRILHEALVNVQKHSGARHVRVSLDRHAGQWVLAVADDGRGFPFDGRMTAEDLERLHLGPRVIKDRLRVIGGSLVVQSTPGEGARLEITVPTQS